MKRLLAQCILVIFVFIMVSCTVGGPEKTKSGAAKTKLVFMFWGTPDEKATVESYLSKFRQKRPDIDIQEIHAPSAQYQAKLQTMISGGTPPDVMFMGLEDFPRYAHSSVFLNLQPFINSDKDFHIDDYYPVLMDQFKYNGDYYGIAKDFATLVLYYNKDLFDKTGLKYPDDSWTWQDFRSTAEKLTKDTNGDGKIDQYGYVVETWTGEWIAWVWQNEGEVMSADGKKWLLGDPQYIDKNVEALNFLTDMIYGKKQVAPGPGVTSFQGTMDFFKTGKVGMCTYGRWACMDFKNLKFNWDVAVIPHNKKRATTLFTVCYGVSAKTQHPQESWDLVKFLTGPEGQIATAESGQAIPSMKSVADSDHFLKAPVLPQTINARANLEGIPYSRPSPTNPVMSEVNTVLNREMDLMWQGKSTPRATITKLQPQIDKILGTMK